MQSLFTECHGKYQLWDEDEGDYEAGWVSTSLPHHSLPLEYRYTKASERDGVIVGGQLTFYSGGGYVHELRGSEEELKSGLETLQSQGWIDQRTRAIIVELTTFNPGSQLFGIIVIKFELPGTGGVIPSFRIEPANLLSFSVSNMKAFELSCQV